MDTKALYGAIEEYISIDDPENSYVPISKHSTKLYFIQNGLRGPIKIGTAIKPYERMKTLQIGNPDKLRMLWFCEPKSKRVEYDLHRYFKKHNVVGEWFWPTSELLGVILETICHSFDGCVFETNDFIFNLAIEG